MDNIMFIGNIGCGKSTWLNRLYQEGFPVVFENLSEISFLNEYWNTQRYAFHTQIGFYASWLSLYNKAVTLGGAFIDSSILSHHMIFTKYMYDQSLLSAKEYEVCQLLFVSIIKNIQCKPVLLYCSLEENLERAEKRSRKSEIRNQEFISLLHIKFNELYCDMKSDIMFIDITNLSPDDNKDFDYFCNSFKEGGVNIDSRA